MGDAINSRSVPDLWGEPEIDRSTAFRSNCMFSHQYLIETLTVNSIDSFCLQSFKKTKMKHWNA